MTVAANRIYLRVVGLKGIRFPKFHLLNDVGWEQQGVATLVRYSRIGYLWSDWLRVRGKADANCSTVTIIDGELPYPDCPTPPDRPLYALKKTL